MNKMIVVAVIFALLIGFFIGFEFNKCHHLSPAKIKSKPKPISKPAPVKQASVIPIEDMKLRYYSFDDDGNTILKEILVDTIYGDTMADLSPDTHIKDVSIKVNKDSSSFMVYYRENFEDTAKLYEDVPMYCLYKWKRLGEGKSPFSRYGK